MKMKKIMLFTAFSLSSFAAMANCQTNSAGQRFCVGDIVYTQYDAKAEVVGFNQISRPEVIVLEGNDKGEIQTFETNLLYRTKQDCILEFCIGTLVRREEQTGFTRKVVGLNKVKNTVMYENDKGKKYSVRPSQLIAKGGSRPAPTPAPTPNPTPSPAPTPSPVSGNWSADNLGTVNGVLSAQAAISSSQNNTNLILACQAPSQDMNMKIELDESYAPEVVSAMSDKEQLLVVQLIVDSEAIELTNWEMENDQLIIQTDALYPDEVNRIKRGLSLELVILVDQSEDEEGQEKVLYKENLSLKGSNTAITLAEEVCLDGQAKE